jgi:hypothetical protein
MRTWWDTNYHDEDGDERNQSEPVLQTVTGLVANNVASPFNPELEIKKLNELIGKLWMEQAALKSSVEDLGKACLVEVKPSKWKPDRASNVLPKKKKRSGQGRGKGNRGGQLGAQPGAGGKKGKQRQVPPPTPSSPFMTPSRISDREE